MTVAPLAGKQQQSVAHADQRINVWEGSVRSGKTVASLIAWLDYVRNGPAGNLLLVGKTERTLKRNIIDPLTEMLGTKRCRFISGSGELWLLGRRVYVAGANDERAQEKIRGLTLAGAYVDEASTLPESFWSMLLTRLSVEGAQLFATTNPEAPRHWLLVDYLAKAAKVIDRDGTVKRGGDGAELDLARFRFTLADNPHLPAAYVDALEREFQGLWRRRYVLGEWVAAEGAVYPMLDPTVDGEASHVVSELPTITRWWIGVDQGFSNPTVALLVGLGEDDRLYACAEWRATQHTDDQAADAIRRWVEDGCDGALEGQPGAIERVWVDPAAPSLARALHHRGWPARPARDEGISLRVVDGIRDVASLLSRRRLLIHERCSTLLDEMVGYAWDEKASERGEDKPLDQDDHGPDALRYCIRMIGTVWRRWDR